jgi:hypothetical protein
VSVNRENEYFISAIFSEKLLKYTKYIDAIIFASIQTDHEGLNIVMSPQKADEFLKLERAMLHDFIKINESVLLNARSIAELSDGYPFVWKPIKNEEFIPYENIKKHFLELGLTRESLIDIFLEPLL